MNKNVTIASINKAKINATQQAFKHFFPNTVFEFTGIDSPSGVRPQPIGEREIHQGATNRIQYSKEQKPNSDFWVSIEGGCVQEEEKLAVSACIMVHSKNIRSESKTGSFYLPDKLALRVLSGEELGDACDILFNKKQSKQSDGAIGLLTKGKMDRIEYYSHGIKLALTRFVGLLD